LEPAIRGTPVVESYHARVFAPVLSNRIREQPKIMKPTIQISPSQHASRSFPLTDYSFQAPADAKSSSSAVLPATKAPAFHRISSEFFGAEASRDYIAELILFILITGIAAWPVMSMLACLAWMKIVI
jgi:hypothetical protein